MYNIPVTFRFEQFALHLFPGLQSPDVFAEKAAMAASVDSSK